MPSVNARSELPAQGPLCQIARILAAGVLRLRKCGNCLAEFSRPGVQPTPESGDKDLDLPGDPRLSVRAG